jgi:hypothetical protein
MQPVDENIRHYERDGSRREQWEIGPSSRLDEAAGFPPMTVADVLTAMENLEGDAMVMAAFGYWVEYDGDGWKAVRVDREYAEEALRGYLDQIEAGDITDQEAVADFLTEIGTAGEVTDLLGVSVSEAMETANPNYDE